MVPHTINMTAAYRQLENNHMVNSSQSPNSSSVITYATNNSVKVLKSTDVDVQCPPFSCTTACRRRLHWLVLSLMNVCDSARHSSTVAYYYYSTVFLGTSQLVTRSTRRTIKWCAELTVVSDGVVRS